MAQKKKNMRLLTSQTREPVQPRPAMQSDPESNTASEVKTGLRQKESGIVSTEARRRRMAAKQGRSKGGQRLVQQEPIEATKAGSGTRAAETKRGATRDVGRLKK
jgi:hypothetical protein